MKNGDRWNRPALTDSQSKTCWVLLGVPSPKGPIKTLTEETPRGNRRNPTTPLRSMANSLTNRTLTSFRNTNLLKSLSSWSRRFNYFPAAAEQPQSDCPSWSSFTFSSDGADRKTDHGNRDGSIYIKAPKSNPRSEEKSVTMPTSFMMSSIVGRRFYQKVTTREADDGNGWTVMLDYRTLKTPSKRPLKVRSFALAKAIAAEWEYQVSFIFNSYGLSNF